MNKSNLGWIVAGIIVILVIGYFAYNDVTKGFSHHRTSPKNKTKERMLPKMKFEKIHSHRVQSFVIQRKGTDWNGEEVRGK